jgi:hypothetical protein
MPIPTSQPRTKVGQDYASLGTLLFCYDANDAARSFANGDSVTRWRDLGLNGVDVTNSGATCPVLALNADGNGNAAVRFDGADNLTGGNSTVVSNMFINDTSLTFFSVAKSNASTGLNQTLCAKWNPGAQYGPNYGVFFYTPNNYMGYFSTISSAANIRGATGDANPIGSIRLHIMTSVVPSGTQQGYANGVAEGMTLRSGGTGTTNANTASWQVGSAQASSSPAEFWNGDIYLLGCFRGVFSLEKRLALSRMLGARFNISITA